MCMCTWFWHFIRSACVCMCVLWVLTVQCASFFQMFLMTDSHMHTLAPTHAHSDESILIHFDSCKKDNSPRASNWLNSSACVWFRFVLVVRQRIVENPLKFYNFSHWFCWIYCHRLFLFCLHGVVNIYAHKRPSQNMISICLFVFISYVRTTYQQIQIKENKTK